MKSRVEQISTLERKLNIHVPAEVVQAAFEKAFKGIQRDAQIKGFRKGKAPLATVKTLFGDRVKQDVIQDIVSQHYQAAINEHSLDPVSYPAIEFDELNTEADFEFTAEFEVRPDVTVKQYEGLAIKREKFVVPDGFLDKTLDEIRASRAQTVPVLIERPAQKGDVAVIDFQGMLLTGPLENGSAQDHELELGANQFIPGFEEAVEGMRIGQAKDVSIAFPEDYHVKELAGKPVTFKTTLKGLKKKELPELNDEFAKTVGPFENLQKLKDEILSDYEKRETKRIMGDVKNRLMRALVEKNPVAVPKALLTEQKKALVDDFKERLAQQGMTDGDFENYKSQWDEDFNKTASFMIQASFLTDTLAKDHSLFATPEDFKLKLAEYAAQTGLDAARINEFYGEQDRKSRMMYQITEEKVVEFLISKAKITDVTREAIEKEEGPQKA